MFPTALAAQLRPSAELAVQLVGLSPDEADARAKEAGVGFAAIEVVPGDKVTFSANLVVGRIRGFVHGGRVRSVQVG